MTLPVTFWDRLVAARRAFMQSRKAESEVVSSYLAECEAGRQRAKELGYYEGISDSELELFMTKVCTLPDIRTKVRTLQALPAKEHLRAPIHKWATANAAAICMYAGFNKYK